MITTEKCCCFELETGGVILAWFGLIVNGILAIVNLILFITYFSVPCESLNDEKYFISLAVDLHIDDCEIVKTLSLAVAAVLFVFHAIDFAVNVIYYIGLKKRNHKYILPNAITELIALVVFVIREIITFSKMGFVSIVLFGGLSVYFFIVIMSIYIRFRDEVKDGQGYKRPKSDSER